MILENIQIKNININFINNPKISILNLKNHLNFDQLIAVTNLNGNFIVIAGPGSGKTRVIIYRALTLLSLGVLPENILILTFTKKSVTEVKERISNFFLKTNINVETFHSLSYKYLKIYSSNKQFSVITDDEIIKILQTLPDFSHIQKIFSQEKIISALYLYINNLKEFNNLTKTLSKINIKILKNIFYLFLQIKKERNLFSFHDLILNFISLLKTNKIPLPFKYIMVDEFQDTDSFQIDLLKLLKCNNIFAVGDDCQSIYSFRGALPHNIFNFPFFFKNSKSIFLKENFRSTPDLVNFSNDFIKTFENSFNKNLFSNLPYLEKPVIHVFKTFEEEYSHIILQIKNIFQNNENATIAILFRNNFFISFFKDYLLTISQEKYYKNISILTIHSSKGLEWDFVFIPTLLQGILPTCQGNFSNLEDEKRLFYVAISRAKKGLYLSYPLSFYCPLGFFQEPSIFFEYLNKAFYNVKRG